MNTSPPPMNNVYHSGSVRRSSLLDWKKTKTELNPTAKDQTTGCSCTNSENFWSPVVRFVKKWKNRKKPVFRPVMCWTLLMHIFHWLLVFESWKKIKNWLRYGQKHFYMQFECMSLPLLPYLSQILTKLLEMLISLQKITISIYVCNAHELILSLFGTINFTTKDQSQLVWTGLFALWTD